MKNKIKNIYYKYKIIFIFLAGCIASLGFAPYNLFLFTIISFCYSLIILENTKEKKKAFFLGLIFGLGHQVASLYWIAISFDIANYGGYTFGALAVIFLSIFLSLITATSFFLIKIFSNRLNNISSAVLIIIIFSLSDWVRGNILWEFPWTPISAIWAFSKLTISPFAILGSWGYSLITFSLIVGIYFLKHNLKHGFLMISPFILLLLLGLFPVKKHIGESSRINVRLVQPNIEQSDKWNTKKLDEHLKKLINLSNIKSLKKIDLVIWPETSVPFDIEKSNKQFRERLTDVNNLIVGAIRKTETVNNLKFFNSLFLIKDSFKHILYHDKLKLVPFGEFIPFRKHLKFKKFTLGGIDFSYGKQVKVLELNSNVKILPLICYEVIFPKITREKSNQYNLIVNITNDGWYGKSSGPYQHLALAKIRAVQEGKFLLRAANTGVSAIINQDGEIIEKIGLGRKGIIDKELVLIKKNTMYSKFGDNIFFLLIILLFFLLIIININYKWVKKNE
ncbi:apolipoprotein N-acyltransferase [Pelagibacteraceae bacterium]|nr:apolipoprotein N-acyltransferase [Pelagibacteraceae bacterium]